jgi:hypothetical protein
MALFQDLETLKNLTSTLSQQAGKKTRTFTECESGLFVEYLASARFRRHFTCFSPLFSYFLSSVETGTYLGGVARFGHRHPGSFSTFVNLFFGLSVGSDCF